MNSLIFIFFSILELSTSIPFENKSVENLKLLNPQIFSQSSYDKVSSKVTKHYERKFIAADTREYIFLSDSTGKVIIIDAVLYEEVISYNLSAISRSITAILNDAFYNIDTINGTILSTNVGNLLQGPENINWGRVGAFPKEPNSIRSNAAVDGTVIYFVTYTGKLYSYDTASRITTKVGDVEPNDSYASLVVVGKVLYVFKFIRFFSFDGASVSEISVPDPKAYAGLFQLGNDICVVGGNQTDVNPDPVNCYNPTNNQWSTPSYITDFRWYPGVVTVGSRTYIFGGRATYYNNSIPYFWRDSVEVLNHETNLWGFIPSPLTTGQEYIQALAFNF